MEIDGVVAIDLNKGSKWLPLSPLRGGWKCNDMLEINKYEGKHQYMK